MRVHCLFHVPFEGLGTIEEWLSQKDATVSVTRFFEPFDPADLPAPEGLDLLIVMGGPMSVNDETIHPWLTAEIDCIRRVIKADKAVLGVCLGAQLIAKAMGARIYPNPEKEIGWWPIEAVSNEANDGSGASCDPFQFPPSLPVFHWHGETFDLPLGAIRLASSAACRNQAFQLGRRVIGLQFHMEMTPESVERITANCRDELIPGPWVQTEADILSAHPLKKEWHETTHQTMVALLDYLAAR